jgi:hypothetical protein
MSESIAAEIWIGGRVSKQLAEQLCEAICAVGVSLGWGESQFAPRTAEELLESLDFRDDVEVLHVCDVQASSGEFPLLEEFLQEHGLPYTRLTEPKYEFDGERVDFRPGQRISCVRTDTEGNPIVATGEVSKAVELLDKAQNAIENGKNPSRTLGRARRILHRVLPGELQPLTPFEIVGEPPSEAAPR